MGRCSEFYVGPKEVCQPLAEIACFLNQALILKPVAMVKMPSA